MLTKRKPKGDAAYERAYNAVDYKSTPDKKYRWCVIAPGAFNAYGYANRKWWPSKATAIAHATQSVTREQEKKNDIALVVVNATTLVGLHTPVPPIMVRDI